MFIEEPTRALKLGPKIRRLRMKAGLTLEDLAARAGLTPHFIGSVELGQRDPSVSTVKALAGALGVRLGALLGEGPGLSPTGLEMARMFERVPEPLQTGILELLRISQRRDKR